MVPTRRDAVGPADHSPRIRGDGPLIRPTWDAMNAILPVFAGMVPRWVRLRRRLRDSPRIRGDGPLRLSARDSVSLFSPYSRGWSQKW